MDKNPSCKVVLQSKILTGKGGRKMEMVAIKALSNKLARASYYVMRDQVTL